MNIDDLKYGQLMKISALFNEAREKKEEGSNSILSGAKGQYVICRSRNEGINCGFLEAGDETGCILAAARRLYYHKPLDSSLSWYEGVAESGPHPESKMSGTVAKKYILEDYSLTLCSEKAQSLLMGFVATGSC